MRFPRFLSALALVAAALVPAASASAQVEARDGIAFDAYLELLKARARAEGVSPSTLERMTVGLTPNARVIRLDQGQPGKPTKRGYPDLAPYIAKHVNSVRIGGGRDVYRAHRSDLLKVERETGVPASIIVAIFGHETSYGRIRGG
ncbi:MAG: lytic murein transglycosylase, partial [Pseudomonadota bacterium]